MNNENQDMTSLAPAINIEEVALEEDAGNETGCLDQEQRYRASAYGLLAALLRASPDRNMLDYLGELCEATDDGDELMLAMSALALSAGMHGPEDIVDEFHRLFIGLGKGELVPYGSWYQTGFLMEKPLSDLRDDLSRLGFQRSEEVAEPEDHVAALCEVLSIMIGDNTDVSVQKAFFESHMADWLGRFFDDLGRAGSAVFYRSVARFGAAFIELEKQYYSMQT